MMVYKASVENGECSKPHIHLACNNNITASFHMINIKMKYDLLFVANSSQNVENGKNILVAWLLIQILIKVHTPRPAAHCS